MVWSLGCSACERDVISNPGPDTAFLNRNEKARLEVSTFRFLVLAKHFSMRKLIAFDSETFDKLTQLGRDRMATLQDLADEAFADVLKKHGVPIDLRDALRKSAREANPKPPTPKPAAHRNAASANRRTANP